MMNIVCYADNVSGPILIWDGRATMSLWPLLGDFDGRANTSKCKAVLLADAGWMLRLAERLAGGWLPASLVSAWPKAITHTP